jgi:hypothetical protein
MIETVKDVFEECLERLRYRPDNKGGIFDREAVELHDRFEAALAAETEAQKSCPYCHDPEKNIETTSASYSLKFQKDKQFDLLLKRDIDYEPWTVGRLKFDYCPMCGRRLEEK